MKRTLILGFCLISIFYACNQQSPKLLCIEGYSIGDSIDINVDRNFLVEFESKGVDVHGDSLAIYEISHFVPDPRLSFISKNFNIIQINWERLIEKEYLGLLEEIEELIKTEPESYKDSTKSGVRILGEEQIYSDSTSGNNITIAISYNRVDSIYSIYIRNFQISDPIVKRYEIKRKDDEYDFTIFEE